jgi:hypothetical protein
MTLDKDKLRRDLDASHQKTMEAYSTQGLLTQIKGQLQKFRGAAKLFGFSEQVSELEKGVQIGEQVILPVEEELKLQSRRAFGVSPDDGYETHEHGDEHKVLPSLNNTHHAIPNSATSYTYIPLHAGERSDKTLAVS